MNMESYIRLADRIIEFEADFNDINAALHTVHTLAIQQKELQAKWEKAETALEELLDSDTLDAKKIAAVKIKHKAAYAVFLRCMSNMAEIQTKLKEEKDRAVEPEGERAREHSIRLPACDTEVFKGDYLSWPTFRDLFTAIYKNNSRLSPVEKLFHLNQKTQGEAKDIVKKCHLTNEGFVTAWKNLCERYENKRILVNSQLQILFNLKKIDSECGSSINTLQRDINNCLASLKTHQIDVSNWDAIITYLCSTKLPENTLALWEQSIDHKTDISKWEDMDKFLSNRFQTLETVSGFTGNATSKVQKSNTSRQSTENPTKRLGAFQTKVTKQTTKSMCKMCKSTEHRLRNCSRFCDLNPVERIKFVKSTNGCLNCLSPGHTVTRCTSSYNCSKCHSRHHTLLHADTLQQPAVRNPFKDADNAPSTSAQARKRQESGQPPSSANQNVKSCHANSSTGVLLGTARVHIHHNGTDFSARALIDSGSECSFITERLKRRINLPARKMHAHVSGITNAVSAQVKEASNIELRSPVDPCFSLTTPVLVLAKLTGNLPSCHINAMTMQAFPDLVLADKRFYVNEDVDLILGGDIYPQIIMSGIKKNVLNTLLAQETVFGWILTGRIESPNPTKSIMSFYNEVALDNQLKAFWEVENEPKNKILNEDERYCEQLFKETTQRSDNGRYTVSLPFRQDYPNNINLGPSLKRACSQFFRNEGRLIKNPDLGKEYFRVLSEYETLGHMRKLKKNIPSDDSDHYFLPHHAVIKAESTTTKVRVVFNASSPTVNGNSLNDILLPGPVLQADLPILILRWKLYRFVFNSDIEKMYRQIWVNENHTKFQRIVHRTSPNDPISLYELKTVTFGVNCVPYLAIRTLLQLADDVSNSHPTAANILREYMYAYDVLAGGHTITSTIKARDEIRQVLHSAGFPLRKWTSNSEDILRNIPKADLLNENFLAFEDTSSVKALGIRWNALSDLFYFKAGTLDNPENITKRAILSAIAKLFDPLGWLAPMVIVAKILMQSIWLEGTAWDEPVSTSTLERWKTFTEQYHEIDKIRIPRWVNFSPGTDIEIHGFCDASEKAYAAVIYMRVKTDDNVCTNLLLAKTRVAPVKTLSLPRLELCGAVLLAEITESIFRNLKLGPVKVNLWTDSTIVLAWIRKPPCSWSTFVAHRITKIIDMVGNKNWLHVNS
ncbi:uncharacterized protein [Eurosta solidaginis]|uniref:uncharacterized protein n=1 Tax=Eurosta solidaginis TaxID=178769 RepID=UPI00353100FB